MAARSPGAHGDAGSSPGDGIGRPLPRVQVRTGDELEDMAEAMNRMASQLADTSPSTMRGRRGWKHCLPTSPMA